MFAKEFNPKRRKHSKAMEEYRSDEVLLGHLWERIQKAVATKEFKWRQF